MTAIQFRFTTSLALLSLLCACAGEQQAERDAGATPATVGAATHADRAWAHYGGTLAGSRFAAGDLIRPDTVSRLTLAWSYRSGDIANGDGYFGRLSTFKATPVFFDDKLILSTGFNRVIALDPATGKEIWRYDPQVDFSIQYSEMFTSRGVAAWADSDAPPGAHCARRVFLGTLDARLIAIDAGSGTPCPAFGIDGSIDLSKGIKRFRRGDYSLTSPPTVTNGVVIVGSSIGDNGSANLDEGAVRAYAADSGALRWRWDPIPRDKRDPGGDTWEGDSEKRTGAANVWSVMSADEERDLVFLPTTSPSPDFYGGKRLGDNQYANSVVALRASTGEFVWARQLVHHDLWDYDLASQPLLIDLTVDGKPRPALVQATKMGFVFVLDRETGVPIFPIEERPVPQSSIPGERSAATQPVPSIVLHPLDAAEFELWEMDDAHVATCRRMLEGVSFDGMFTPPSLGGTMLYPGNPGGVNWGSMAADPNRNIALVAVNRLPTIVKLIPRKDFDEAARDGMFNGIKAQFTEQSGTPYGMARFDLYNRENSRPCQTGPWATLVALDLNAGNVLWESPAGLTPGADADSQDANWGFYVRGGPMITGGGVGFLATPFDFTLRGFDIRNGDVIWSAELPAQPGSTPMGYQVGGSPYVVVTAGGARADGQGRGDYVLAYRLSASAGSD